MSSVPALGSVNSAAISGSAAFTLAKGSGDDMPKAR
jgi:hypothetical protein